MVDHLSAKAPDPMLISHARGARLPYPSGQTVPEVFQQWVDRTPLAVAVEAFDGSWTYSRLSEVAEAAARIVANAALPRPSLIGLPGRRTPAFVAAALGVLRAGHAYLPLEEDEPAERREMRLADCAAVLEWSGGTWEPTFSLIRKEGAPVEHAPGGAGGPAYLLYTSGSTGRPKGVLVPHEGIVRLVCGTDYLQITPEDVCSCHANLCFDASTFEIWGALLNGARLVIMPTETLLSPEALEAHLQERGVTVALFTTSLFNQLALERPGMFATLRAVLFGGEAASAAAIQAVCAHGRPKHLLNAYGPTEISVIATVYAVPAAGLPPGPVPIGSPIANTDVYVLDKDGQPATEGELYLGGPGLAIGYHRLPEQTAQRFLQTDLGRLFRTGDLARWRADGQLDFLGRQDRQVKVRGFRVEPGEIEAALHALDGISQAAVVARKNSSGEVVLAGYFVGEVAPEEVRQALREKLPPAWVPAALHRLPALPLTPNGKLDEKALPEVAGEATRPKAGEAPRTPLEREIANVWAEVLEHTDFGAEENFFDVGGTSLALMRVHRRLAALTPFAGVQIVMLFQHPTIRRLAQSLDGKHSSAPSSAAHERAQKQREALARRRLLLKR